MLQGDLGSAIVLVTIVLAVAFIAGAPLLPARRRRRRPVGARRGVRHQRALPARPVAVVPRPRRPSRRPGSRCGSRSSASRRAGVTGTGLGAGRAKWGYLPESHTDFIFAVIAEELGLIGVIGVSGCSS